MKITGIIGENDWRNIEADREETRIVETRLMCKPGVKPVIVPAIIPRSKAKMNSQSIKILGTFIYKLFL